MQMIDYGCSTPLCYWILDQVPNWPFQYIKGIPLSSIMSLLDSYLYNTPPSGYSFIPSVPDIFGVIDYYLGFNADTELGCKSFYNPPPPAFCYHCNNQSDCVANGCYWWSDNNCRDIAEGGGAPPSNCDQYTTQLDCINAGCFWYDGTCHQCPEITIGNYIVNTKGHTWSLSGNNLQTAINDLSSGTVFVGGNITLYDTLIPKDDVCINFLNNYVTLAYDKSFVYCQGLMNATIKNVFINLYPQQSEPVIHVDGSGSWWNSCMYNTFENIYMFNTGGYYNCGGSTWCANYHNYDGILLEISGTIDTSLLENKFINVSMEGCKTGIHLYTGPGAIGWGNGNLFRDIWIDQFENMVWFDINSGGFGYNQNYFYNIKGQGIPYSQYGFRDIAGNGNFFEACLVWDWFYVPNQPYTWIVSNNAEWTFICSLTGQVLDNGVATQYC